MRKLGWAKRVFRPVEKGSIRGSVFTLFSGSVGSGVLALPKVVSSFGVTGGILLIMINAILTYYSYDALFKAIISCNKKRYPNVVNYFLGRRSAKYFVQIVIGMQFLIVTMFCCIGKKRKKFAKISIFSKK